MRRRLLVCLAALALVPALSCPARCQTPPNITPEMRRDDPRLGQRVTISKRRIYLGDLAEYLTHETDIPIACGQRDGSADLQLAVHCRDLPLADILDAIWSTVS